MKLFKFIKIKILLLQVFFILILGMLSSAAPQSPELHYMRIGQLQQYFSSFGAESEDSHTFRPCEGHLWPAEYGEDLANSISNSFWIGARDFYDPVLEKTLSHKVVGIGPRLGTSHESMVFEVEHRLIGKFNAPTVIVNGELASYNLLYDDVDEIDENLSADRIILTKVHTSMGISMTRKIMAFSQQNHDDYFIYEYVFKNTGIIDGDGTIYQQTLNDVFFYFQHRYAPGGREPVPEYDSGWGIWNSSWGRNCVNQVLNPGTGEPTIQYSWYGPHSERLVSDDWGCPNQLSDGRLGAVQYIGFITLHADQSAYDLSNDPCQPITTYFIDSDDPGNIADVSQYNETSMTHQYELMTLGHAVKTQAESIEEQGVFADQWGEAAGGYSQTAGYGPYSLAPGDSIRIVVAEGVNGLCREFSREVGANWLAWYNGIGTPMLIKPDGSETTNYDEYKREWVQTGEDSLLMILNRAKDVYENNFNIPVPPPPPENFVIDAGADRFQLMWSNNATSWPNFDGYVIWRAKSEVLDSQTEYELIFQCDASNVVHEFNDTNVLRGFDYYYCIQTKDNGSTNDIHPGTPLYSSKFWTLSSQPVYLLNLFYVYPGDTDNNGVVNAQDLLPIGIFFRKTCSPRDSVSVFWEKHQVVSQYTFGEINADANGDGVVNEKDVIAIGVNWGNTHSENLAGFTIAPDDKELLNEHREAFLEIYNSLSGKGEAVQSMKRLLENVLEIKIPKEFVLEQNFPNPFNPVTNIRFSLPEAQRVTLTVYNTLGQVLESLLKEQPCNAGIHTIPFCGHAFESGIYFCRIQTETWQASRKMIILK